VDPMTGELALQLGRAIAYLFREVKGKHRIVVGKDTRLSGYMLETAMASGICSMGADVMLVGRFPRQDRLYHDSMRANAGSSSPLRIIPTMTTASKSFRGMVSNSPTRWNIESSN